MNQCATQSFTVPAGAGAYAPEELYLNADNNKAALQDLVSEFTPLIESLPAGASIEVDFLRPAQQPGLAANWVTAVKAYTVAGLQALVGVSGWRGVRVRAKSGGNAGAALVHVAWF